MKRRCALDIHSTLSSYLSVALSYKVINHFAKLHRQRTYDASVSITEADHSTTDHIRAFELNEHIESLVGQLLKNASLCSA